MTEDEHGASVEMPRYRCHKKVWALKIKAINGARITPEEPGYASFQVDGDYLVKHNPQVGGYYVVYDDGYKSFSPAKAFEEGYTRIPSLAELVEERRRDEGRDEDAAEQIKVRE